MRQQERVIAAATLLATQERGTLIVNRTAVDSTKTNCWWTADDVLQLAPCPVPDDRKRQELQSSDPPEVHEFDAWCYRKYISTETGTARLLLPVHNGAGMAELIQKKMPQMKIVLTSSAIASSGIGETTARTGGDALLTTG